VIIVINYSPFSLSFITIPAVFGLKILIHLHCILFDLVCHVNIKICQILFFISSRLQQIIISSVKYVYEITLNSFKLLHSPDYSIKHYIPNFFNFCSCSITITVNKSCFSIYRSIFSVVCI